MTEMTAFEYAVEMQKQYGDEAKCWWLTVGELVDLLRPQEDFLNAVEFTLTDPAHDAYGHPPAPLDEQVAAEAKTVTDWLGERTISEPSPTKDDQIANYILSLTPDEREHAANIIDGVSSREWWEAQEEKPF